jgi:hypothetical protein
MAINFPTPTAVGQQFVDTASGNSWQWDGIAWISDGDGGPGYVLKTGDTMTGTLVVPNATIAASTGPGIQDLLSLTTTGSGGPDNGARIGLRYSSTSSFLASHILAFTDLSSTDNTYQSFSTTGGDGTNERARIDSSGRLLVGTSSSTADAIAVFLGRSSEPGGTGGEIKLAHPTTNVPSLGTLGRIQFGNTGDARGAEIWAFADSTWASNDYPANLVFSTTADGASSPTERMRITSAGETLIGQQSSFAIKAALGVYAANYALAVGTASGPSEPVRFYNGATSVGAITTTASGTAYNTSSDYRLKENVAPLTGAIDRVNELQVHRFNFIADPDKTVDGFIAHEAQEVVPECVTGTKDEVDEDGNPVYQGIDQSKLVPLLTAALQEALAEIESLKARVTALEP